jgi:hypothetical protein
VDAALEYLRDGIKAMLEAHYTQEDVVAKISELAPDLSSTKVKATVKEISVELGLSKRGRMSIAEDPRIGRSVEDVDR